jgi:hypothetical protein
MRLNVIPLACLVILLGLSRAPAADDKIKESSYYPLKVGTKWTYKAGGSMFVIQVAKHEKIGDVVCGVLETAKDGNVIATEHVGVTGDGIYRYSVAGQKPDNPFRILKLPPKKGDSWKVEAKVGGQVFNGSFKLDEAEITVPAGKYKTFAAASDGFQLDDGNGNQIKISFKFWFAEKVGLVKQTIQVADKPELVIELEKFEGK